MEELIKIQRELKAPKNQRNSFGKYNYRSCEDILEAVKPLANKLGCAVILNDCVVQVGDRIYVQATATLISDKNSVLGSASAFAREPLQQKGMNEAQITGSASSYARKYALNGLFAIDDTKDSDTNEHKAEIDNKPIDYTRQKTALKACKNKSEVRAFFDRLSNTEQTALKSLVTEFALKLEK